MMMLNMPAPHYTASHGIRLDRHADFTATEILLLC